MAGTLHTKVFKVLNGPVKVRSEPGGAELPKKLQNGEIIEVEPNSQRDLNGYVWWKHSAGWSAEKTSDGKKVFMGDPSAPSADDPPDVTTLPMLNSLFERLPIDLDKVTWVQYFGNTQFAYKHGKDWNYDGFAQGMHPGLDLGNPKYTGPVYAGVNGVFDKVDKYGFHVDSGDYHIIYQHLVNCPAMTKGAVITPNTVVGTLEPLANSNAHLHLEIRYRKEKFIVNPFLVLPKALGESCTGKFSTFEKHFYKDTNWNKWQTPLDQPVILRGGKVIGPRG